MALTKASRSMLNTGISDSSDATALTFSSAEDATFAGHVSLADSKYLNIGTGSDLKLWHDGSHSRINNATGNFNIQANDFHITDSSNSSARFIVDHDGATTLYYNGNSKLVTANDGIDVTGKIDCTTFESSGAATIGGALTVTGNLQVDGTTTTINSTSYTVDDKNITLASGAGSSSAADGAGITIDGASATWNYVHSTTSWDSNKPIRSTNGFIGPLTGNVTGNASGTAATVTGAAQSAITSVGTLTTLTVDDITINGSEIVDQGGMTIAGETLTLRTDASNWTTALSIDAAQGTTLAGHLIVNGNTTLGNADSDTVTVPGPLAVDTDTLYVDVTNDRVGINVGTSPSNGLSVSGVITSGNFSAAGIGGTPGDANTAELGPGYLILARDDTADAAQIKFGKNGAVHSYLETRTNGLGFITNVGEFAFEGGNVGIGYTAPGNSLQVGNTGHSGYAFATISNTYGAVIQVGQSSNPTSAAALWVRNLNNSGTAGELFRVNGDGKVGIGTTSPGDLLHVTNGNNAVDTRIRLQAFGQTPIWSTMYAGGTESSPTVPTSGTDLLRLAVTTWDGTDYSQMAGSIRITAEANHGNNSAPSYMSFWTNPTQRLETEKMRITAGGLIGIAGANAAWIDSNDILGVNGRVYVRGYGHSSMSLGRYNSAGNAGEDGTILDFLHGGSGVGAIAINNTTTFQIKNGNGSGQLQLCTHDANESIELNPDGNITFESGGVEEMRIKPSTGTNVTTVSVGNNADRLAGEFRVHTGSTSGGVCYSTGSMQEYRNVCSNFGSGSANYWHIKTNFKCSNNIMFVGRMHGYAYGNSGNIIDVSRSGYAYAGSGGSIINSQTVNNGNGSFTLECYEASDDYVCFRGYLVGGYYTGTSFDIKMPSPTGYNWNFQVISQVYNTTSGNHF